MYLLGKPDCLRGFTKMGKIITPTVKRQIGATTINIDSRDIVKIRFYYYLAGFFLKVMRIYLYLVRIALKFI